MSVGRSRAGKAIESDPRPTITTAPITLASCSLQLQEELLWRFCKKSVEYLLSPASLVTNNGPLFGVAVGPIRPKDERTNEPTNKWKRHPLNQFHDVRRVALPREFVFDERCTRSADPNPSIRVARANMNRRAGTFAFGTT